MNARVSICFIINNLGQGGAERQFVELIKHIDKTKFDVTLYLYAVNKGVFFKEIFDIPGVRVVQNVLRSRNAGLKIIEALRYIRRILKDNHFDIVQTTLFMNGLFVRLAAPRRYRDRMVSNIRTSLKLYTKYHLFAEKMLLRRSYVVANSRRTAEEFLGRVPRGRRARVRYIYNGYDTGLFSPRQTERPHDSVTLGCVGRMYRIKNQMQVVRVVHAMNTASIRLMVIGDSGDQENAIIAYIREYDLEDRIALEPKQSNIEDCYNRFDIFILPSLLEGCPNVLFEAMLCGCFCIISTHANTDEFVLHGENGLVYDGTDEDLQEQLQYAISVLKTEAFDRIRENGRRYACENFSMEKMVKSYEDLYREIVYGYTPDGRDPVQTAASHPVCQQPYRACAGKRLV
jgi:glycosyltransferase involved in cell wall biosynthesis